MSVFLARLSHCRCVDDGHEFRQVIDQHAIKQCLVPVLQVGDGDVAIEIGGPVAHAVHDAGHLQLLADYGRREQAPEPQLASLCVGEGCALVADRVV